VIRLSTLLFDLDGTLIDSKQDLARSIHYLQRSYHRPLSSEEEIARFIGDGVQKLVERAIGSSLPSGRKRPKKQLALAVDQFKSYYRAHALDHTRAYAGVLQTLAHFRRKKMAVVTNKPTRVSKHILVSLGLAQFFPVILGGDSVIRKKPNPEPVLSALNHLGVRPGRDVLMVGDGFQDVLAGRAAGVRTCGIFSNIGDPEKLKKTQPDFTVRSLPDLMRIFN
jgi:phosphoglycolate phosphatase